MKQRRSLLDLILNIIIVFFAVLSFFPLYWLLASSFKFSHDIIKIPPMWYPENFTLQNYYNLFSQSNTWKWLINSLIVAGATTNADRFGEYSGSLCLCKARFLWEKCAVYCVYFPP